MKEKTRKTGALILISAIVLAAGIYTGFRLRPGDSGLAVGKEKTPDVIYTMQIGHAHGVENIRHEALKVFKSMVEERTNGGVIVDVFPNGQLGTEAGMHEEVKNGTLQAVWGGGFDIVPKLMIFTLPFLAGNAEEMEKLINSEFMKDICRESENKGVIVLGIGGGGGFRQFSNNVQPVRAPEDLKGLRMRINDIDTIGRTMKALGAEVVSVSYNDLYASLKSGDVDGQENPWSNIVSMHFYEVQKYFTEIDYQFHPNPFYVNLEWFRSLPEKYQKIVRESAETMMKLEKRYEKEKKEKELECIKAYSEVYVLSEEERQAFREAVQSVYDDYLAEGLLTREELDRMQAIMEGREN